MKRGIAACIGVCVVAIVAALLFARQRASDQPVATYAAPAFCSQSDVVKAEAGVPLLSPSTSQVTVPGNEPKIIASVNGEDITAAQLETMVNYATYSNRTALANLGPNAPASLKTMLSQSTAQIRQRMLTALIDNAVWLNVGKASGLYASEASAKAATAQSLSVIQQAPVNDPARVQFEANLCANHLTEATFPTDPRVIQRTRDTLTVAAARRQFSATLSPAVQQNAASVQAALNAYVQSLWAQNNVHIYLPGFAPLRT